jgi:hypothetical protein
MTGEGLGGTGFSVAGAAAAEGFGGAGAVAAEGFGVAGLDVAGAAAGDVLGVAAVWHRLGGAICGVRLESREKMSPEILRTSPKILISGAKFVGSAGDALRGTYSGIKIIMEFPP